MTAHNNLTKQELLRQEAKKRVGTALAQLLEEVDRAQGKDICQFVDEQIRKEQEQLKEEEKEADLLKEQEWLRKEAEEREKEDAKKEYMKKVKRLEERIEEAERRETYAKRSSDKSFFGEESYDELHANRVSLQLELYELKEANKHIMGE